jgi:hypothetical protein
MTDEISRISDQEPLPTPDTDAVSRLGAAIAKIALPEPDNSWLNTAPSEKDIVDKLTGAIEQVVELDNDVNLALYERIRQIEEWREFITQDWHSETGYHYTIDAQLNNMNGSVTYLSVDFFVELIPEWAAPDNLDEYDAGPFTPKPTLDVVRMVAARRIGASKDADAQVLIQAWLERGEAVRIVNYTAEEVAHLRDTAEDSNDPNIFRLTVGHKRKVVVDEFGGLVELPDIALRDVNSFVEPKSSSLSATDLAENLIAVSKRRAANEAAEGITRKAEYKVLQWKEAFGELDTDGVLAMRTIEKANGVPEDHPRPEEIVVGRGELVTKSIREHELERWDSGVTAALHRNLIRTREVKYIIGPLWWQDLTPYSDDTEFGRLEEGLRTKLQAFFDMYSGTPESIKALVEKYSHLALEQ